MADNEEQIAAVEEETPQEEEDLVDPMIKVKEESSQTKECAPLLERLNTCNDRVNSKSQTTETCTEELIDYLHCADHCVVQLSQVKMKAAKLGVRTPQSFPSTFPWKCKGN